MDLTFAPAEAAAIPVHVIEQPELEHWLSTQPDEVATWVKASGFAAGLGTSLLIHDTTGVIRMVLAGYGDANRRARSRFHLAAVATALPKGVYRLEGLAPDHAEEEALGWLLSSYVFDRYKDQNPANARLCAPDGVNAERLEVIAAGEALTRDLINTPASDMGPSDLEAACVDLAARFGAETTVIRGEALLEQNFPMVHTVGRASDDAPRLIDMRWGNTGPTLTLVG